MHSYCYKLLITYKSYLHFIDQELLPTSADGGALRHFNQALFSTSALTIFTRIHLETSNHELK